MAEFKWVWGYLRKYKLLLVTALILSTVVALLVMVNPYIQGRIVDEVIQQGKTELLLTFLLIMAGTTVTRSVIRYIYQYCFEFIALHVANNIREAIYSKVQALDFEFFDKTKTGDIMSRMTGDLEAVRHFSAWVIFNTFYNVLMFIAVMTALFFVDFGFTLMLVSVTPITAFLTYRIGKVVKPVFSDIREQFSRLNSVVQENISGNRVVKAFAREDHEIRKFSEENEAFRQKNLNAAKIWEKYLPVLDSMAGVLSAIIILAGGILVIRGALTLGELITFNGLVWALNNPMRMAGWLINDTQRFAASAEKIMLILMREPAIKNTKSLVITERMEGQVEFQDVSFSYAGKKVLRNISFIAKPGQTVAIVGPTGSGKSTLVSLISRFYECTGGKVLIDGHDVRELDLQFLRKNIGVAMQDIFLFSDTIEGNIAYGEPEAPVSEVQRAAGVADAHGFIHAFPEEYDTIIGERGVGLSGGQRQRIALARTMIGNPSILILDDTTSSVDIETEHEIQCALKPIFGRKTTFIIAHRISSVKSADVILVLADGRIVERGTHDELLLLKGHYYQVFMSQYNDFNEKEAVMEG